MRVSQFYRKVRWASCWLAWVVAAQGQLSPPVKRVEGMEYPWLANLARVQGKVELEALISRDGKVEAVREVTGHHLLSGPAKNALSRWLFAGCASSAGPCKLRVNFSFVLEGKCDLSRCGSEFSVDLPDSVVVRTKAARPIID